MLTRAPVLLLVAVIVGACSLSARTVSPAGEGLLPDGTVPFVFDRPLVDGMTAIAGRGPAGVPILLQDVTFMGTELGRTTIGPDGRFTFATSPLAKGHRLGLSLGDLTGTRWNSNDFALSAFFGPGAMQVPQVGFFYDTEMVTAK